MNIRAALLEEKKQTRSHALAIAAYACSSAARFKTLMHCFLDAEYRLAQRAAWCVSWAAHKHPAMLQPYIKKLVAQLDRKDVHPAVVRNSVRVLEAVHIPEALHGAVMRHCFALVEAPGTPVAIKAFSLTTLGNLAALYPDIKTELQLLIEERWPHETAAFHARARKVLQALSRLPAHMQATKASK